jgi:hypothetical protein
MEIFIGAFLGLIASVLVTVWAENLRRPKLRLTCEDTIDATLTSFVGGSPSLRYRAIRVRVSNKGLPRLFGWIVRAPALQCRGTITFHRFLDGQNLFGNAMTGRWANGPQPNSIPVTNVANGKVEFAILDPERLSGGSAIDIYPGESEPLDIVVRFDNDENCYGWNNETYFLQPPALLGRNPKWKLGHDPFLVKITIGSSGQKCEGVFQLINDVPLSAFRLEKASKADRAKVL